MKKVPNFEEIRSSRTRGGGGYFIGVTKLGSISFYGDFLIKENLGQFQKCLILLDKEQNLIGLQLGNVELGAGLYNILNQGKNYRIIFAGNFFMRNNINIVDWYGKYVPLKFENRPNCFYIDLENKI